MRASFLWWMSSCSSLMLNTRYIRFFLSALATLRFGDRTNPAITGDDELLEADHPHHVLFQGGELQGRQAIAVKLHDWLLGGKVYGKCSPRSLTDMLHRAETRGNIINCLCIYPIRSSSKRKPRNALKSHMLLCENSHPYIMCSCNNPSLIGQGHVHRCKLVSWSRTHRQQHRRLLADRRVPSSEHPPHFPLYTCKHW